MINWNELCKWNIRNRFVTIMQICHTWNRQLNWPVNSIINKWFRESSCYRNQFWHDHVTVDHQHLRQRWYANFADLGPSLQLVELHFLLQKYSKYLALNTPSNLPSKPLLTRLWPIPRLESDWFRQLSATATVTRFSWFLVSHCWLMPLQSWPLDP